MIAAIVVAVLSVVFGALGIGGRGQWRHGLLVAHALTLLCAATITGLDRGWRGVVILLVVVSLLTAQAATVVARKFELARTPAAPNPQKPIRVDSWEEIPAGSKLTAFYRKDAGVWTKTDPKTHLARRASPSEIEDLGLEN